MDSHIYLDNNATTRPFPEVVEVMSRILGPDFGNPSSAHSLGEQARCSIHQARESVALLLGCMPENLVFTASGTEANNMVLLSTAKKRVRHARIITTAVEHSSILAMCEHLSNLDIEIIHLPVDRQGLISLDDLAEAITPSTVLVSVQWVNNETGVIQPVEAIGRICRDKRVLFHTDAAQAVGKIPINLSSLPIDFLAFTGHKFHGPQGIGGLYAKQIEQLSPIFYGGEQENGLRAGTENVPGIVGIGKAAEILREGLEQIEQKVSTLRDRFETQVLKMVPGVTVNGDTGRRISNTTNLCFSGVDGQALIARLDQLGIYCSQSSACTNRQPEPSYVLRAMRLSESEAYSSVRFGFSCQNTMEEVEIAANQIAAICNQLRQFNQLRQAHFNS